MKADLWAVEARDIRRRHNVWRLIETHTARDTARVHRDLLVTEGLMEARVVRFTRAEVVR